MSRFPFSLIVALCVALLMGSLSIVAWRQGPARDAVARHQRVQEEVMLERDERAGLQQRIRHLESRKRVVTDARALGFEVPDPSKIFWLSGGDR